MTSRDCDNVAGGDKCGTVVPQQVDLFVEIGCGDTPRWGCVALPHSRGSATEVFSECPRGAMMALKDDSDNEAVRSRGEDLVPTRTLNLMMNQSKNSTTNPLSPIPSLFVNRLMPVNNFPECSSRPLFFWVATGGTDGHGSAASERKRPRRVK